MVPSSHARSSFWFALLVFGRAPVLAADRVPFSAAAGFLFLSIHSFVHVADLSPLPLLASDDLCPCFAYAVESVRGGLP